MQYQGLCLRPAETAVPALLTRIDGRQDSASVAAVDPVLPDSHLSVMGMACEDPESGFH